MTPTPLRTLGRSGLVVSRLGLGLAALGRPGYLTLGHGADLAGDTAPEAMAARAHAMLDLAHARGVRYFDAARSYGLAESFLATWLERRRPEGVVVGSKWGYRYAADWQAQAAVHEVKEHSLARLNAQWQESHALLGAHLKLYQIHSATLETGVLEDGRVLERLAALRAETGVRIGLSLSGPRQLGALETALGLRIGGSSKPLFDTVQATYNALEPSVGPGLAAASEAGMGVIVKEALANGRLTVRNPDPAQRAALVAQARRLGARPDALALAFVLREPWADVVLSGASTKEQLESNLDALNLMLDEEALEAFGSLREEPEAYWESRSRLAWS